MGCIDLIAVVVVSVVSEEEPGKTRARSRWHGGISAGLRGCSAALVSSGSPASVSWSHSAHCFSTGTLNQVRDRALGIYCRNGRVIRGATTQRHFRVGP